MWKLKAYARPCGAAAGCSSGTAVAGAALLVRPGAQPAAEGRGRRSSRRCRRLRPASAAARPRLPPGPQGAQWDALPLCTGVAFLLLQISQKEHCARCSANTALCRPQRRSHRVHINFPLHPACQSPKGISLLLGAVQTLDCAVRKRRSTGGKTLLVSVPHAN